MSVGCGASNDGHAPFDLNKTAKIAISLGMSLEEFDRLDVSDIPLVLEALDERHKINQEGVIANLIRQNTFLSIAYAPMFKSSGKPKKVTDIFTFSYEAKSKEINKDEYSAIAKLIAKKYSA